MTWAEPGDLGVDVPELAGDEQERLVEPSEVVLLEEHGRYLPSTKHFHGRGRGLCGRERGTRRLIERHCGSLTVTRSVDSPPCST